MRGKRSARMESESAENEALEKLRERGKRSAGRVCANTEHKERKSVCEYGAQGMEECVRIRSTS
jgi:hypothetical protein